MHLYIYLYFYDISIFILSFITVYLYMCLYLKALSSRLRNWYLCWLLFFFNIWISSKNKN